MIVAFVALLLVATEGKLQEVEKLKENRKWWQRGDGSGLQHLHVRPRGGKGPLQLTPDLEGVSHVPNSVVAVFDAQCLSHSPEAHRRKAHGIAKAAPCLSASPKHFRTPKVAFSFFTIRGSDEAQSACLQQSHLDWDSHCVKFFVREPALQLLSGNRASDYSTLTEGVDFKCETQTTWSNNPTLDAWGLDALDSGAVRDGSYSHPGFGHDNGMDLYILDGGVRDTHVEFYNKQVVHVIGDGPQWYEDEDGVRYWVNHGTHVAGIAGGINYGASKNLTIYDLRICVFAEEPVNKYDVYCTMHLLIEAYQTVLQMLSNENKGRRGVINLSIGGSVHLLSPYLDFYFKEITEAGGIVVVAAGNNGKNACDFSPAYSQNAITVGAYTESNTRASWSNWGECVDVWGPGKDIRSAKANCDDCYANWQGTSMASPNIAGLVAAMLFVNPALGRNQVLAVLKRNTHQITGTKCEGDSGYYCPAPYLPSCDVPTDADLSTEFQPTFSVNAGRSNAIIEDSGCNFVTIEEKDRGGDILSVSHWPTGACINASYGHLQAEQSYSAHSYECVDNTTVSVNLYLDEFCEVPPMETHQIVDGYYDGLQWYSVTCDANGGQPTYDCQRFVRVFYVESEKYCYRNETTDGFDTVAYTATQCYLDSVYYNTTGNGTVIYEWFQLVDCVAIDGIDHLLADVWNTTADPSEGHGCVDTPNASNVSLYFDDECYEYDDDGRGDGGQYSFTVQCIGTPIDHYTVTTTTAPNISSTIEPTMTTTPKQTTSTNTGSVKTSSVPTTTDHTSAGERIAPLFDCLAYGIMFWVALVQ